jgi:hypothetical protein
MIPSVSEAVRFRSFTFGSPDAVGKRWGGAYAAVSKVTFSVASDTFPY